MDDSTTRVLEQQIDALAGRIAELEAQIEWLVARMSDQGVAKRMGLDVPFFLAGLQDGGRKAKAAGRHGLERSGAVHALEHKKAASRTPSRAVKSTKKTAPGVEPPKLWRDALEAIQRKVSHYSFDAWFKNTTLLSDDGHRLTVGAPNQMGADWLSRKYLGVVEEALLEGGRTDVKVVFVARTDD
jgi:hypothetical protein